MTVRLANLATWVIGNPPDRPKAPEVEFSIKEFLHEEVKIYRLEQSCGKSGTIEVAVGVYQN